MGYCHQSAHPTAIPIQTPATLPDAVSILGQVVCPTHLAAVWSGQRKRSRADAGRHGVSARQCLDTQFLVLGISRQKLSIPLLWHSANRDGNCTDIARKTVLRSLMRWIKPQPHQRIYITADREFIRPEFRHRSLALWGLIPVIRIRANAIVRHRGRTQKAAKLFDCPHWRLLRQARNVYGSWWYLAGKRLADGDFMIVYSDRYVSGIGRLYGQRWGIETLFGAYKSRGFHLESCRVVDHARLRCLLFVLSLGLVWAIQTGQWLIQQGQVIPQRVVNQVDKTADQIKRNVYSLFRHGLDELRDRVLGNKLLLQLTQLLSCH